MSLLVMVPSDLKVRVWGKEDRFNHCTVNILLKSYHWLFFKTFFFLWKNLNMHKVEKIE